MKWLVAMSVSFFMVNAAHAAADVEAGKAKVQSVCAACHGATGVSVGDAIPNLAGQKPAYLEAQLKALKDGTRKNPVMNAIASQLSPDEIANVAAYFATQSGATATAKSDLLPNLVKSSVSFPEGYQNTFKKYHTINFPATRQVRYYFANNAALAAAKDGKTLPNGSVLFAEVYSAKLGADGKPVTGARRLLRRRSTPVLHGDGAGCGLGQGHSGNAAQRGLELRRVHDGETATPRCQPGRVPRLPQAARQGELHVHARPACRGGAPLGTTPGFTPEAIARGQRLHSACRRTLLRLPEDLRAIQATRRRQ